MMTKCYIIIGANLMFVLFSLPVATIGPALASLYYVMLECLWHDSSINPFAGFWKGFRANFVQGILCELLFAAAGLLLFLDIRFCRQQEWNLFLVLLYAILILLVITGSFLFPVMAAFRDSIPHLIRNALFFAFRRPWKLIPVTVLPLAAAAVTVLDEHMRPLYGFLWVTCLAGLLAMLTSAVLINDFAPYQGGTEKENRSPEQQNKKSLKQQLKEQEKLDR